jgi:hypothetical protein
MSTQIRKYYLGRFNVISAYSGEKVDFLLNGLSTSAVLPARAYAYAFFDSERLEYSSLLDDTSDAYLSGLLVKYRPREDGETVDWSTGEIEDLEVHNRVQCKSRFILHVKTGIIAYHVIGDFTEISFKKIFCDLFERSHNEFFVDAEIQAINHEVSFLESLERLDSIKKISIYLHPSNPSNRAIWKAQDERIKRLEVKSYTEIYQLREAAKASAIRSDDDVQSKLRMAMDGYGKAKVVGVRDGDKRTLSTGDNPITCDVEIEKEESDDSRSIISKIAPTLRHLFKRMKDVE